MRKLVVLLVVVTAALAGTAAALAGGGYGGDYGSGSSSSTSTQSTSSAAGSSSTSKAADTYSFKATLTAAAEVPKPKAPAGAGGSFVAKSTESGSKVSFHWTLKFHGLSGKAMAAHVHLGKKGVPGAVAIPLCGPCTNGQSGTVSITSKLENALEKGGTYVNVHTAKNAAGEIRGQVALTGK